MQTTEFCVGYNIEVSLKFTDFIFSVAHTFISLASAL